MKLIDLTDSAKFASFRQAIIETSCPICPLCRERILEHFDLLERDTLNGKPVHQECLEDLHYEILGKLIEDGKIDFPITIDLV